MEIIGIVDDIREGPSGFGDLARAITIPSINILIQIFELVVRTARESSRSYQPLAMPYVGSTQGSIFRIRQR